MAEQDLKQSMLDAIVDADSLEKFVNGSEAETVLTRLSAEYPTIKNMVSKIKGDAATDYQALFNQLMIENNIAGRHKTLAELQTKGIDLPESSYALVADDTDDKNGIYIKEGGSWVKSKYDTYSLIQNFIDKTKYLYDALQYRNSDHVFGFVDNLGNLTSHLDKNGVLHATDFKSKDVSLKTLKSIIDDRIGYLPLTDIALSVVDARGNFIVRLTDDGQLHIPDIKNGMSVQQRLKEIEPRIATTAKSVLMNNLYQNMDAEEAIKFNNLLKNAAKQPELIKQELSASLYGDGSNHHIQRIPCIYRIDNNNALLFFNRGLKGYDGDAYGAELFRSKVTWDNDYKITNVAEPELFYSLQDVEAGSSVKHPTIGRLRNGNLIMLIDRRIMSSKSSTQYTQEYSISTDNGNTWQAWQDITLNNTFIQPEENITLVLGTGLKILTLDSGRLVTPVYTSTESTRRMAYMYSDDDGQTWSLSNPIGGSESIGNGIYFGESPIILNKKGELLSYARDSHKGGKHIAISKDYGETLDFLGTEYDIKSQAVQAAATTMLDGIVLLTIQEGSGRTDFTIKISFDDGYTFSQLSYKPYSVNAYKGYASLEVLDDKMILMAVEGAPDSQQLNKSESIELLMVNINEVIENGSIS